MDGNSVWSWTLPILVSVGGTVGTLVLALLFNIPEKLLGETFDRRMESYRSGLEAEIEKLRARLALLGDRGVRANELEFKAVITAWDQFVDTYQATFQCVVQAVSHPDFARMTGDEARQYLSTTSFSERQQADIMMERPESRNKAFVKTVEFRDIHAAGQAIYDAHATLRKQGIFIPEELEKSIASAIQKCSSARAARYVEFDVGYYKAGSETKMQFLREHQVMFDALKADVRKRIMESITSSPSN